MSPVIITIIGGCAAFGTTAAWLPQVVRTWRSRSAEDFSWGYLAMFSTGVALWIVYGILKKDGVIIAANAVTFVLVIVVAFVKMREKKGG
ncbi:MAG: MtN3 and saliva related transrane protein [Acidobacteriota bacterium]|jgi:MtN3 and saliva related transmembrane protein|nr:MtN3 and saliva related transrane protein [Acidobacteriota bacterium]